MSLLGGIGSALSTFAAGDLQARHTQDERKREQEQRKLQGLQILLGQNDLPMEDYIHAIGALGDLTGNKPTKQVADLLYQQMGQKLPVQQIQPEQATQGVAGQIESQIGAPPPMTQVTHETVGQMPRDVYQATLLEPIKERERKAGIRLTQQVDPSDNEYTLWYDADGRLVNRTHSQIASVANKQAGIEAAKTNIDTRFENQLKLVDERGKVKAKADVDRLVASGMSPADASAYVIGKAQQDKSIREARIGLMQAQKNAIPERVAQGWANVDANQLRTDIAADLAKKNIDTAAFDRQTKFAFDDLGHVNSEIDALQKRPDLLNGADPSWNQQLLNLTNQRNTLLNYIYTQKGQFVPAEQSAPRVRGTGRQSSPNYVAPKVNKQALGALMQP